MGIRRLLHPVGHRHLSGGVVGMKRDIWTPVLYVLIGAAGTLIASLMLCGWFSKGPP